MLDPQFSTMTKKLSLETVKRHILTFKIKSSILSNAEGFADGYHAIIIFNYPAVKVLY